MIAGRPCYGNLRLTCIPRSREGGGRWLVDHFLKEAGTRFGREVKPLTGDALRACLTHQEADAAKQNLIAFQGEIVWLREERVRMLARLANARARLRFQETLAGLTPDADIRALEEVRDHVNRLVAETQVSRDLGDTELERRLGRIREAEAESGARAQLEELKRARRGTLVPMVLPEAVPVR